MHPLDRIAKLIEQIQDDIMDRDEERLLIGSLHEFETIDRPFQLIQATIELTASIFTPESLGEIAKTDEESINAWAIALMQTLQAQLSLLEGWEAQLASLPLPEALKQKIGDRTSQLQEIAREQSTFLRSTRALFSQEAQLRQDAKTLQQLKKKAKLLKAIKSELQTTDLDKLRDRISTQEEAIAPQRQELETLKEQKAQLDSELESLQQQKITLDARVNYLQHRYQRLEAGTHETASEAIELTVAQEEHLSEELQSLLGELSQQQQEYQQTQENLASAIEESNRYQKETDGLRHQLQQYYQSNQELANNLPVNRQKIDGIVKTIQDNLAILDQELARALQQQEDSAKKTTFTF